MAHGCLEHVFVIPATEKEDPEEKGGIVSSPLIGNIDVKCCHAVKWKILRIL